MQYLLPVGFGPSSKMCPRCPLHFLHTTSSLSLSFINSTLFGIESQKLGHPVPDSNFLSDENSSAPHPAQRYSPFSLLYSNAPVPGSSVLFSFKMLCCCGVSFFSMCFVLFSSNIFGGTHLLCKKLLLLQFL